MGHRPKEAAVGFVALATIGVLAVCCGGPCAFLANSRTSQTATTSHSGEGTGAAGNRTPQPSFTSTPSAAEATRSTQEPSPPSTPVNTSTASVSPPPAKVATAEPEDDGSSDALAKISDPEPPAAREWASSSGKFRINGKLTGFSSGEVQLLKESGNLANVSLDKLSAADRQYVKDVLRVDKSAKVIIGKVVEVIDGDTITLLDEEKKQHRVRLEGIDAPEQGQAFGSAAKKALSEKIFDTSPWVEWKELDKYDRILGHVYLNGRHINLELVGEGYAWHYKEYSKDPRIANAEIVARRRKLGLWSDSSPTPPWDFRRNKRD